MGTEPKWMRRMLFIRLPSPPSWRICFILWELSEIEVKACYFQTKTHMKRPREGSGIWALDFSRSLCVPLMWTAYCGLCRGVWLGFWVVLGFRHKPCEIFPWKIIAVYGKWYFFYKQILPHFLQRWRTLSEGADVSEGIRLCKHRWVLRASAHKTLAGQTGIACENMQGPLRP